MSHFSPFLSSCAAQDKHDVFGTGTDLCCRKLRIKGFLLPLMLTCAMNTQTIYTWHTDSLFYFVFHFITVYPNAFLLKKKKILQYFASFYLCILYQELQINIDL